MPPRRRRKTDEEVPNANSSPPPPDGNHPTSPGGGESPRPKRRRVETTSPPGADEQPVGDSNPKKSQKAKTTKSTRSSRGNRNVVKLLKKGRGVVDEHSGLRDKVHVYETSSIVFQCTLNQTNVEFNNNKFYIIQLLEGDSGGEYWLWTRWGRVGVVGQSALEPCCSLPDALRNFKAKYRQKTGNEWTGSIDGFQKVEGKYQLMQVEYGEEASAAPAEALRTAKAAQETIPSTLPEPLQNFLRFVGSTADMERAMKELEIDTAKMPLGKISRSQIKEGFQILKEIEKELTKAPTTGRSTGTNRSVLVANTSMFYTLIPHDFGFRTPPVIDNLRTIKVKMELLEMLADLEVATKILSKPQPVPKNPLDATYDSLNCRLDLLEPNSEVFKRIRLFVANTHGMTHTAYRLEVREVFAVDRLGEATGFTPFLQHLGNRMMLWHGSRSTNFLGILSRGLRIAPPEAPSTGYMFGKGVYFADAATKAANYCHTSPAHNEGVLLLCDVALGKTLDLTEAKYLDEPPKGFDSTKGLGKMQPNAAESVTMENGVVWPLGPMGDSPGMQKTALLYNEYVVYNVSQLRICFAVRCVFRYRK